LASLTCDLDRGPSRLIRIQKLSDKISFFRIQKLSDKISFFGAIRLRDEPVENIHLLAGYFFTPLAIRYEGYIAG